jgi:hypothetical protein
MRRIPGTHHNRWGYRGVEEFRGRFRASAGDHSWRSRYYASPVAAAKAYDAAARRRYGKLGFYNFPRPGERQVEPIDEDYCAYGHERALHTYFRPSGKPAYCTACNRLAQRRSKAQRKVRA